MFTATKKQQHYLKQLAALQFPGSIDNLSTRMPIYALEQQLPKDDTMKLDDADDTYKVPYPFDCDRTVEALNRKNSEEEALTAAQRLFFWTEYKKTIKLD